MLLFASLTSKGTVHNITVGPSNTMTFSPNAISNVLVGDTIRFTWATGTHNTTCDGTGGTSLPGGAATWTHPMNSSNTTFDYPVTVLGHYAYRCTFHSGMNGTFDATGTVGMLSDPSSSAVNVFPNPFTDRVNVSGSFDFSKRITLNVINIIGEKIKCFEFNEFQGINSPFNLDLADLKSGMYFISSDALNNQTIRIIKK